MGPEYESPASTSLWSHGSRVRTMAPMEPQAAAANPREWRGHFVICGWHEQAGSIVRQLVSMSGGQTPVALVNEVRAETMTGILDQLREDLARAPGAPGPSGTVPPMVHLFGDPADESVQEAAGAGRARAAVIVVDEATGPPSDDRTLPYTLAFKSKNSDAVVVVEVLSADFAQYVRRAGADEVVVRDVNLPFYLVAAARSPGLGTAARRLFGADSPYAVRREPIPDELRGGTLADVRQHFRRQHLGLVLGIISDPEQVTVDQVLGSGTGWVDQFIQRMLAEAETDVLAEAKGARQVHVNPPDDLIIGPRDFAIVVPEVRRAASGQGAG